MDSSKVVIDKIRSSDSVTSNRGTKNKERSGVAIHNGLTFSDRREIKDLVKHWPDSILLSLALNGSTYVRRPHSRKIDYQRLELQLTDPSEIYCLALLLLMKENGRLFNLNIIDLIAANDELSSCQQAYREVELNKSYFRSKDNSTRT